MNLEIISKNDAKILRRTEYVMKLTWDGPMVSKKEIREKAIAMLNSDPKTTVIKSIRTKFGKQEATVVIYVYESEDVLKQIEPKYVLKRNGLIEVKE